MLRGVGSRCNTQDFILKNIKKKDITKGFPQFWKTISKLPPPSHFPLTGLLPQAPQNTPSSPHLCQHLTHTNPPSFLLLFLTLFSFPLGSLFPIFLPLQYHHSTMANFNLFRGSPFPSLQPNVLLTTANNKLQKRRNTKWTKKKGKGISRIN